jgi:2'-5' RNA ligase
VSEAAAKRLRLFFALWPSGACRAALAMSAAPAILAIDGMPVAPGNLHVTLAFLGPVPGRTFGDLVAMAGREAWPAIDIAFDRVEYWAKGKVAVAMATSVPQSGLDIEQRLWRGLEPFGFAREARPWRPHLTLVRKVRRPPPENLALAPVEMPGGAGAWRLALVESTARPEGVRYKPLADWPLT